MDKVKRSRLWARKANLDCVKSYVASVNHDILLLIVFVHDPSKYMENEKEILKAFLHAVQANQANQLSLILEQIGILDVVKAKLHREDVKSAGQVSIDDVVDVILNGNIREQMTLIMNFGFQACDIIWKLINIYVNRKSNGIVLPKFISVPNLVKRVERIGRVMGASNPDSLDAAIADLISSKCVDDSDICVSNNSAVPCLLASLSKDGNVTYSRLGWPDKLLRTPASEAEQNERRIKVGEIYPELSEREMKFQFQAVPGITPEIKAGRKVKKAFISEQHANKKALLPKVIPLVSGHMYFNLNKDTLFYKLASRYNHDSMTGPSGNTDIQLDVSCLFSSFENTDNFEKMVLACIVWMCDPPDHSVHEILIAAIPYGLKYDGLHGDRYEYKYLRDLIVLHASHAKQKHAKHTTYAKQNCPVYLPENLNKDSCNTFIFNKNRKDSTVEECMFNNIAYPETIGNVQYVIGRNKLLETSGFVALSNKCSKIRTLVLPYRDTTYSDPEIEGVEFWNPRINNLLIKCAFETTTNNFAIRMLISKYDIDVYFKKRTIELPEGILIDKISIFSPNTRAQSVVESCQLFFFYKGLKIFVEPVNSHELFYTAFIVKAGTEVFKEFKDITGTFKRLLRERIKDQHYKLEFNEENRYYPDVRGEVFG